MRRHRYVAVLAVAAGLTLGRGAHAQADADKATARELGQSGETKLAAEDFKGAEADFQRANALYHAPTLVLGLARAQAGQGKFVEAWESYHSIILENPTSSAVFAAALADAQKEIAKIETRRAKLTVNVTGATAPKVTIDDQPVRVEALGVPRLINPGAHVVKATADGMKTATQTISVTEGGAQNVALALTADTSAPVAAAPSIEPDSTSSSGSWRKTAGIVAMGVGGAGLIEGAITGILAIGKHSDLAKVCTNGCPPTEDSTLSSYHTMGTLSTVGFIVGGVAAAGGAVLFFTAPKGSSGTITTGGVRWTPYVGVGSLGATGTF